MTRRILAAWGATDDESAELARVAVEAIRCGKPHPDRPDIQCTDLPHDRGPVYCRNSALRVEWWVSPAGTTTIHDDLGPISLANLVAPMPEDDGRGRYLKLPANVREAEDAMAQGRVTPGADAAWLNSTPWDEPAGIRYWTDAIPPEVATVYTTDGQQWTRNRHVGSDCWDADTPGRFMSESGLLEQYGSVYATPVDYDGEPLTRDEFLHDRYRQLLEDTIGLLTRSAEATQKVADKYTSSSKTLNVTNYRALRDTAAELRARSDELRTLTGQAG